MNPTIKSTLLFAEDKLNHLESGNKIALRLLTNILHQPATFIWAHPEQILSDEQHDRFETFVQRASRHEPLAYILGYADFYGLQLQVDERVLIPRPETEQLIDITLEYFRNSKLKTRNSAIVDIGTGSGCIALALAKHLPDMKIYATDISPEALEVAQNNAKCLDISNVTFLLGSLTEPLAGRLQPHSIDVVVANLPYIPDDEFAHLPDTVKNFEPELALRSGPEVDTLNRQLAKQAQRWLKPGGLLTYETANGRIITHRSDS